MKILTYKYLNKENLGFLSKCETKIYPQERFDLNFKDMNELIDNFSVKMLKNIDFKLKESLDFIEIKDVEILAPIKVPKQDIICVGLNFYDHIKESEMFKKEIQKDKDFAVYFTKRVNEAVGHKGFIDGHFDIVDSLDYEVELAVIIGKNCKNIENDDAINYIFGYTIINDISARNIQNRHKQWFLGKSFDTFTPMGPHIVTKDEFPAELKVNISSKINGELRQNSNTENFIYDVSHVVSELSRCFTLKAGTIISMGTPAGVGMGFEPPKFLKSGDTIECFIEGIGMLENKVK